jgi:hypothetical protein
LGAARDKPRRRNWERLCIRTGTSTLILERSYQFGEFVSILACPQHVRLAGAGSTGRRNTGVKSLCRGFKLQGLTWSFVELTSHFVQIGLRMHRQVGALWEVLSQQAIGVLVRAALPRTLRVAKIYLDFGRQRKATMIRKFLARSRVSDLYSSFGSFFACLMSAETTVWVSLPATLANIT